MSTLDSKEGAALGAEEALLPFRPGADGAWDRGSAAHLARRAAFGNTGGVISRILDLGPGEAATDLFLEKPETEDVAFASGIAKRVASLSAAQSSWAHRMLLGSNPALEKLALFWHGHFATSERKVENAGLMMRQVALLREKGAGPFEDLLLGIARDPAMLLWLDGNSNRSEAPNENFARELMELFSLGIGHYAEKDIKEAARAFTGWHSRNGEYWFNERTHDRGTKEVFGKSGPFGGEDVVRLCAERPECSELIASKLFEFYVHPAPGPDLRRELGRMYAGCGKRTAEFLARLLSSRVFYSGGARRSLVSTPADFTVGSIRTLEARASAQGVVSAMTAMGQELLAPPSVKGWDMGQAWLSSTTLLARYSFATSLAGVAGAKVSGGLEAKVPWESLGDGVEGLAERLFPEGLSAKVLDDLRASAGGDAKSLVVGCLQLPEYQFV
ncbi:MAG TPA: DUF1800 domain-containing protein [Planctomycetota bacterium]|nr:DUF1800 domain-containing protein [Planctomycetota bacterium]